MSSSDPDPSKPVYCPGCKRLVGRIVLVNGQPFFYLGDILVVRAVYGVCANCGAQFNYSVADKILSIIYTQCLSDQVTIS